MSKQPFIVTVEFEIIVLAENEKSILEDYSFRSILSEASRETISYDVQDYISSAKPLKNLAHLPYGWEENYLIYGSEEDITIKEAFEAFLTEKDKSIKEDNITQKFPFMIEWFVTFALFRSSVNLLLKILLATDNILCVIKNEF